MKDDEDSIMDFSEGSAGQDDRHRIENMPRFEEALATLAPLAEQVDSLLRAAAPDLDERAAMELYFRSVHCALQAAQRRDSAGELDMDALVARIHLPAIADTLPLLLAGFERCRPLWKGSTRSDWRADMPPVDLVNAMSILVYLYSRMRPPRDSGLTMLGAMSPHDLFD